MSVSLIFFQIKKNSEKNEISKEKMKSQKKYEIKKFSALKSFGTQSVPVSDNVTVRQCQDLVNVSVTQSQCQIMSGSSYCQSQVQSGSS